MNDTAKCELCGEPMPVGEEMFKYHWYSGNCPNPALPKQPVKQKIPGLVWAIAKKGDRKVTMLFDTPEQANAFVAGIEADEPPAPTFNCMECGMPTEANEYHPYAACLMFKGCHDGAVVRANLDAVVAHGVQIEFEQRTKPAHDVDAFYEDGGIGHDLAI